MISQGRRETEGHSRRRAIPSKGMVRPEGSEWWAVRTGGGPPSAPRGPREPVPCDRPPDTVASQSSVLASLVRPGGLGSAGRFLLQSSSRRSQAAVRAGAGAGAGSAEGSTGLVPKLASSGCSLRPRLDSYVAAQDIERSDAHTILLPFLSPPTACNHSSSPSSYPSHSFISLLARALASSRAPASGVAPRTRAACRHCRSDEVSPRFMTP